MPTSFLGPQSEQGSSKAPTLPSLAGAAADPFVAGSLLSSVPQAFLNQLTEQAAQAVTELLAVAKPSSGSIFVVGCSSSEVAGEKIGSHSSPEVARAILAGILPVLSAQGIFLAAQCCEHLNRALILEGEAAERFCLEQVNLIPQPKAGGSFATAAFAAFSNPVAVEQVQAVAGIDIGGTLIGMHLRRVAVPVRLSIRSIGEASILCARTRPAFVGGIRTIYDERLL